MHGKSPGRGWQRLRRGGGGQHYRVWGRGDKSPGPTADRWIGLGPPPKEIPSPPETPLRSLLPSPPAPKPPAPFYGAFPLAPPDDGVSLNFGLAFASGISYLNFKIRFVLFLRSPIG